MPEQPTNQLQVIGWREWIELPELGIRRIKAKVDSGARSSSLHVSNIEQFEQDGVPHVRFRVHPSQRKPEKFKIATAQVIDVRVIRSSSGETTTRPVISTPVRLLGEEWHVELTLADRSEMGFRMLLGREAFRGKFLIDAGNSFFGGKPKKAKQGEKK